VNYGRVVKSSLVSAVEMTVGLGFPWEWEYPVNHKLGIPGMRRNGSRLHAVANGKVPEFKSRSGLSIISSVLGCRVHPMAKGADC